MAEDEPELPLSPKEAKRVVVALLAYPVALAVVAAAGLVTLAPGADDRMAVELLAVAFVVLALVAFALIGATVRLTNRAQDHARTEDAAADATARIPLGLLFGDLGRRAVAAAGYSRRVHTAQRVLLALAGLVVAAWVSAPWWIIG